MTRTAVRIPVLATVAALALSVHMTAQADPEVALRAAVDARTLQGCKVAIPMYEKAAAGKSRSVAARALIELAGCYEAMGDGRSSGVYEQVARDYKDQPEASLAQARLAQSGEKSGPALTKDLICSDCTDGGWDISRDGRWLVQIDRERGDLLVRELPGGRIVRRLAAGLVRTDKGRTVLNGGMPRISPNAQQIVFAQETGVRSTEFHIRSMVIDNRAGAKPTVLLEDTAERFHVPLSWSADSRTLWVWWWTPSHASEGLARVSVGDKTFRSTGTLPRRPRGLGVSPDGRYLAYTSTGPAGVRMVATDGSGDVEIAAIDAGAGNVQWTLNGTHVLFTSPSSGLWSVRVLDGKAVGQPQLVRQDLRTPGTLRSGAYYYVERQPPVDVISIVAMEQGGNRIEGQSPRIVKRLVGVYPSLSPDGSRIAFRRRQGTGSDFALVLHSIESGDEQIVSRSGLVTAPAVWFPDGRALLVTVREEGVGTTTLYRFDLNSREFVQLQRLEPEFHGNVFSLTPDGNTLYLAARDPGRANARFDRIVAFDLASRQSRQRFTLPADEDVTGAQLSPDGRTLALGTLALGVGNGQRHLARVAIDGTGYRRLVTGTWAGMAWTRDSSSILFSRHSNRVGASGDFQVMRVSADGGEPVFTGLEARDQQRLLISLTRDGSRLAYSSSESVTELWALDHILPNLK